MHDDKQLDAVEEIALHAIDFQVLSAKGQKFRAYQGHRVLTNIHHSEGTSFTISERLTRSRPLSTGSISCFGSISLWRWYFPGNTVWRHTDVHIERARSYTVNDAHSDSRDAAAGQHLV